jgi:hypothetical protein
MAITTEPSEAFTTLPDDEVLADTVVALEEGGFSGVQPKSDRHTVLVSPVGPFVGPNAPICTLLQRVRAGLQASRKAAYKRSNGLSELLWATASHARGRRFETRRAPSSERPASAWSSSL